MAQGAKGGKVEQEGEGGIGKQEGEGDRNGDGIEREYRRGR